MAPAADQDGATGQLERDGRSPNGQHAPAVPMLEEVQSRVLLHNLLGSTSDRIYFKDRQGRFIWAADHVAHVYGYADPTELVGKSDSDHYDEETCRRTRADELHVIETGETYSDIERIRTLDGTVRWMSTKKMPLVDEFGQTVGIFGINRDVTQQVENEKELAKRTEELARSNSELEQFAYVASHDLQEPLRMVSSYTQLLARRYSDQLDGAALEFIDYAVEGVERMKALINDLLAYSRVGSSTAPFEKVDLNAVLRAVRKNLESAIEEADATLTCDELPEVIGDEIQLVQLFQNLVANGIKFRDEANPHVHVGAREEEGSRVLSVKDNGIGIDPDHADRIFMIFQRLHTRDEYEGTGIGLSVCKKIVERHGGEIRVSSEGTGQGTEFLFTLPFEEVEDA